MARLGILVLIIGMAAGPMPGADGTSSPGSPQTKKVESVPPLSAERRAEVARSLGKLPLAFEVNEGQTDSTVKFLSRQGNSTLFLTSHEAVLVPVTGYREQGAGADSKFKIQEKDCNH